MWFTPKGLQLYACAREIALLLTEAQSAIGEGKELAGQLRIGSSTTIASYVLPERLAAFHHSNPRIRIELTMGNTEDVLQAVRHGLCPVGLIEGLPRSPSEPSTFHRGGNCSDQGHRRASPGNRQQD
jgi:LysR family transcriptional regulator, transcriptional activator of the cysJI operon